MFDGNHHEPFFFCVCVCSCQLSREPTKMFIGNTWRYLLKEKSKACFQITMELKAPRPLGQPILMSVNVRKNTTLRGNVAGSFIDQGVRIPISLLEMSLYSQFLKLPSSFESISPQCIPVQDTIKIQSMYKAWVQRLGSFFASNVVNHKKNTTQNHHRLGGINQPQMAVGIFSIFDVLGMGLLNQTCTR